MARKTEHKLTGRKSMAQTMMHGLKAVSGREVPNYTLLYLDETKNKKRGEFQPIVVPYIELGRSGNCVVSYGETYSTVSRKHASISWENGQVVLTHMGKNPTLVNGAPVNGKWHLQNGDEIQLSHEGPRIRFNSTPAKTSTMKFTARMAMFAQQALKPYKYAVAGLAALLIGTAAFAGYTKMNSDTQIAELKTELVSEKEKNIREKKSIDLKQKEIASALAREKRKNNADQARIDELERKNASLSQERKAIDYRLTEVNKKITEIETKEPPIKVTDIESGKSEDVSISGLSLSDLENDVYYVFATKMEILIPNQEPIIVDPKESGNTILWTGSAFLTDDGRLVTARHVVQPWRFELDKYPNRAQISNYEIKGATINAYFQAYSNDENKKPFTFSSAQARYDDSSDETREVEGIGTIREAQQSFSDWAFVPLSNAAGKIKMDTKLCQELPVREKLHVIGYSLPGLTQPRKGGLSPLISDTQTGQDKIVNGVINVTDRNFEAGNSGGPVFARNENGELVAIGIVSAGIEGLGVVVPVSNINK